MVKDSKECKVLGVYTYRVDWLFLPIFESSLSKTSIEKVTVKGCLNHIDYCSELQDTQKTIEF